MRFKIFDEFKLYGGVDFSTDGLTMLFGCKLANIKIILPWTGAEIFIPKYNSESILNQIWFPLAVTCTYISATILSSIYSGKRFKKEIEKW